MYFLQGPIVMGGVQEIAYIRNDIYNILNNFGFDLIVSLCEKYKLDIFDMNMYDLVYGALHIIVSEIEQTNIPILSRQGKIQFIDSCIQKNEVLKLIKNIKKDINEACTNY